jgi:adenylate cyclase
VRLACQLRPQRDLIVAPLVPPGSEQAAPRRMVGSVGEERFVVAMFVDMRGSTRLAESHLPFDVVFQINRFLETIATAVRGEGGVPNQFLGDGMLALFGLQTDAATAGRQALAAVAAIGREVEALNAAVADAMHVPIRFGIGVDAGNAVLGEIGERQRGHSVFTAIGDAVNVAARLQSATKPLGIEALISEGVYEMARIPRTTASREVRIEGRDSAVMARAFARARDVLGTGDAALESTAVAGS